MPGGDPDDDAPAAFVFTRRARSWQAVAAVGAVWAALLAALVLLDAAWWLMALLALPTLPALYDLWADPSAGLRLEAGRLDWHSGRRSGTLPLAEIDRMRFDTRWDFTVKVSALLHGGRRVRLPQESLPPHRAFEAALTARGVAVERHHFAIF